MPNIDRILDRGGAFAVVLLLGALAHLPALRAPEPLIDERVFVGAARSVVETGSPYRHPVYNYPPPLAHAGAWLITAGGDSAFLAAVRAANLAAGAALAWFAAGFAVTTRGRRLGLACALVAAQPILHQALDRGNLAPVAAALALFGWKAGRQRPWWGSTLVGASLVVKPTALIGALFVTGRRALARTGPRPHALESVGWIVAACLLVAPWWQELAELAQRMLQPPAFSGRNLSLRRALGGFGLELPAGWIAGAVLLGGLVAARAGRCGRLERIHVAAVLSLLALPVVWSYAFLLVLPLQVEAAARWWRRRAVRRSLGGAAGTVDRWGVPLALAAIQGSFAVGVEFAAPAQLHSALVLLPILSPLGLLAYLRATTEPEPS